MEHAFSAVGLKGIFCVQEIEIKGLKQGEKEVIMISVSWLLSDVPHASVQASRRDSNKQSRCALCE